MSGEIVRGIDSHRLFLLDMSPFSHILGYLFASNVDTIIGYAVQQLWERTITSLPDIFFAGLQLICWGKPNKYLDVFLMDVTRGFIQDISLSHLPWNAARNSQVDWRLVGRLTFWNKDYVSTCIIQLDDCGLAITHLGHTNLQIFRASCWNQGWYDQGQLY